MVRIIDLHDLRTHILIERLYIGHIRGNRVHNAVQSEHDRKHDQERKASAEGAGAVLLIDFLLLHGVTLHCFTVTAVDAAEFFLKRLDLRRHQRGNLSKFLLLDR